MTYFDRLGNTIDYRTVFHEVFIDMIFYIKTSTQTWNFVATTLHFKKLYVTTQIVYTCLKQPWICE